MSAFKERIAECLKQPGKSRAGLARACGIKQPSVSDWISGRTKKVEGENLLKAAKYFHVTPEWLATGVGKKDMTGGLEINEPASIYKVDAKVISMPERVRPAVTQLLSMAEHISDIGIGILIGRAEELINTHPLRSKANSAQ